MAKDEEKPVEHKSGAEGHYANHYRVGYNAHEIVIDFGQFYAGDADEYFHTRIITSPRYAREMLEMLRETLANYEAMFGSLRDDH